MRRLVSRPGIDAYCGRSLTLPHDSGGLFQPGTAVEPFAGVGGEDAFGVSTCGETCVVFVPGVGAVFGGTGAPAGAPGGGCVLLGAGACAEAANAKASAAPAIAKRRQNRRLNAPVGRAMDCSMGSPPVIGLWRRACAGTRSASARAARVLSRTCPCLP